MTQDMIYLKEEFWVFLKYLLICPLVGFTMTVCLLKTIEALHIVPFSYKTFPFKRKAQCWIYLSLFALSIALLIRSFS